MHRVLFNIFILVTLATEIWKAKADIDLQRQILALFKELKGKRVGVLTNPTGVDQNLRMLIDDMYEDKTMNLTCFFAPEHGLRGDQQAGAQIVDYVDPITNLPVYSVYGTRIAPTDQQLSTIDVLVYYIQDVGTRYYTYIWTMTYAMDACAKNSKEFIVFDRPNPLNGIDVEGCPITFDAQGVGRKYPKAQFGVPQRYGMTIGELALLANSEWADIPVNLKIIQMIGYNRSQYFDNTNLAWIVPSPNMPTFQTAVVYAGQGLIEQTNISEGRGTTKPFEIIGAPYVDAQVLTEKLRALQLPGVMFRPMYFTPTFSKYQGELCGGIQVHVIDRSIYQPVRTSILIIQTIYNLYPQNVTITNGINRLFGWPDFQDKIKVMSADEILNSCQGNITQFQFLRRQYLLYSGKPSQDQENRINL